MKTFRVYQAEPAYPGEPNEVGEGVLFSNGTVALSVTLPRIVEYYRGLRLSVGMHPSTVPPTVVLEFEAYENGPPGRTFRGEFDERKYPVLWPG